MNPPATSRETNILYRPLIPLVVAHIIGILIGSGFSGYHLWAYLIAGGSAGVLCYRIFRGTGALFSPLILLSAAGYLAIQFWMVPPLPATHISHFVDTQRYFITGTVRSKPVPHRFGTRLIIDTKRLENGSDSFSVTGKIRVTMVGDLPEISSGTTIRFPGRIRSIHSFQNPGGFDYKRFMGFKRIHGSAWVKWERIAVVSPAAERTLEDRLDRFRTGFSMLIDDRTNGAPAGILKTLVLGDRGGISPELRETFNRVGISHLFAISGLHIGMVCTIAFFIFKWCLSRIPFFLWHAWTRKGAALFSILPVLFYGALSGMSPSTQRAVVMVFLFLMTFVLEKEHDLLNTLALAGLVIVVVFPPSVFSISFQLSFAAVLTIVYGISNFKNRWMTPSTLFQSRLLQWMLDLFMVSMLAYLGTLPLVLYYFNQVSLVGPAANCFFVPLFGFVVVPLGLLAVFLYPVMPSVAALVIDINAWIIHLLLTPLSSLASLPFAAISTVTPGWIEMGCYYGLLWMLLMWIGQLLGEDKSPAEHRRPKVSTLKGITAGIMMLLTLDIGFWIYQRYFHPDLKVTMIDVGQGTSFLLELPKGKTVLVDGGGFSDNSTFDVGARVVAPLLWRKKIASVDTVVVTHPNSDHLNGLLFILDRFHVHSVWSNSEPAQTAGYEKFLKLIETRGIRSVPFHLLSREQALNGVQFSILSPPSDFLSRRNRTPWRDLNNNSIVVRVEYGLNSFLLTGDIESAAESELVKTAGSVLKSTVLVLPHHGSRTSSTAGFLNHVSPKFVVVSAGWKNRYRFPHPEVVARVKAKGCRIFRTDLDGAVTFITDGKRLDVTTVAGEKVETVLY